MEERPPTWGRGGAGTANRLNKQSQRATRGIPAAWWGFGRGDNISPWNWTLYEVVIFFLVAREPLVDQCLLIFEASRSHSGTPHSVGPFWTSDQAVAETSTWQHTSVTTDRHSRFKPAIPTSEWPQTHTRPRGHWDRHIYGNISLNWIRTVSDKNCCEDQNTHLMFSNVFPKIVPFMR